MSCHLSYATHPHALQAKVTWLGSPMPGLLHCGVGQHTGRSTCFQFHKSPVYHITIVNANCFLKLLFKKLVLLCLMLPYFPKGFILWHILQEYVTVSVEKQSLLSFYSSPLSVSFSPGNVESLSIIWIYLGFECYLVGSKSDLLGRPPTRAKEPMTSL